MRWTTSELASLRREIAQHCEETAKQDMATPQLADIYVPGSHAKALDFGVSVVVGMRGAGKSYWASVLKDDETRQRVGAELGASSLAKVTHCSVGFSTDPDPNNYPGKRVLAKLLQDKYSAKDIWTAVIAWHVVSRHSAFSSEPLARTTEWEDRVRWVRDEAEKIERLLFDADRKLAATGSAHLILFDALDRTADDWTALRQLLKGLLQVLVELRSFRAIRAKAFLRPDMIVSPDTWAFPDASKLEASRVALDWSRADLYGLLFQRLGNLPEFGLRMREWLGRSGMAWKSELNFFQVPIELRQDEGIQREAFHTIAGPYMGNDRRRGLPYTWLPNHLGDVVGRTSPRSFLAAVGHSANYTAESYPSHKTVLHYEAIKQGVRKASEIRKKELDEDFPWVGRVMQDLSSLTVPCEFSIIRAEWKKKGTLEQFKSRIVSESQAMSTPPGLPRGAVGIKEDLMQLHMFQVLEDGRINIPDVYRIGYGLGRLGGVKAVK